VRILVTGGAGFIGSNFVRFLLNKYPKYRITVLDALTYCGNLENFDQETWENSMFSFWHGDIQDVNVVDNLMRHVDVVVHMAAETHVDRSIENPNPFVDTDVRGTQVLLEAIRQHPVERFIHISTSEVYGTAQAIPMTEEHPLLPQSPYAGAKVGADRLAYSYYVTYNLPIIILRPFNNYGPHQYPEKLIPLFITNAFEDKPLPVYGDGTFTRDWLYVEDTCGAIDKIIHVDIDKLQGEVINIGSGKETSVNTITRCILERLGKKESLIKFVEDRPGHVSKLISSTSKAEVLLNWSPTIDFNQGIEKTIDWYLENQDWWRRLKK